MKRFLFLLILSATFSMFAIAPVVTVASESTPTAGGTVSNAIPYKKEKVGTAESAGKTIALLVVLLSVACGGLFIAKKYFPQFSSSLTLPSRTGPKRRLMLVESMRLGPRTSLFLVQVDGRELLLAQSGEGITAVSVKPVDDGGHSRLGSQA